MLPIVISYFKLTQFYSILELFSFLSQLTIHFINNLVFLPSCIYLYSIIFKEWKSSFNFFLKFKCNFYCINNLISKSIIQKFKWKVFKVSWISIARYKKKNLVTLNANHSQFTWLKFLKKIIIFPCYSIITSCLHRTTITLINKMMY